MTATCLRCGESGWICEQHPDQSWPHGSVAALANRVRSAIGDRRHGCRRDFDPS